MSCVAFKNPEEERDYYFEFADQVEIADAGESLTGTPTIAQSTIKGSGTVTIGATSIVGTKVKVPISGGTIDSVYEIVCTCPTDTSPHKITTFLELQVKRVC